jgi:cytidyltransferase-like protein
MAKKIVCVSGGFDPIHVGHVRMIQEAAALGDELIVIINNDNWLMKKKGYVFMPQDQRREIIEGLKGVTQVVFTGHELDDEDRSVCRELRAIKPHVFANGGDRKPDGDPVPEVLVCDELGIEMIYNVGQGGKMQSSSWLTAEDRDTRDCFCGSGSKYIECHGK